MQPKYYANTYQFYIPNDLERKMIEDSRSERCRNLIQQKLIEIDSFRNAKREILKGNSSSIVKGYLANDIENRIEVLKYEINEIVSSY